MNLAFVGWQKPDGRQVGIRLDTVCAVEAVHPGNGTEDDPPLCAIELVGGQRHVVKGHLDRIIGAVIHGLTHQEPPSGLIVPKHTAQAVN